jgi:hypothetical protein
MRRSVLNSAAIVVSENVDIFDHVGRQLMGDRCAVDSGFGGRNEKGRTEMVQPDED